MGQWKSIDSKKVVAETFGVEAATPVGTQTAVASPTGGGTTDAEARTAIDAIIAVLVTFGLVEEEA